MLPREAIRGSPAPPAHLFQAREIFVTDHRKAGRNYSFSGNILYLIQQYFEWHI